MKRFIVIIKAYISINAFHIKKIGWVLIKCYWKDGNKGKHLAHIWNVLTMLWNWHHETEFMMRGLNENFHKMYFDIVVYMPNIW